MAAQAQRPIVIRRIKKIAAGHHGGAWKVAYADFVTAMMAFFMLLWLLSNPDKEMLKGLADYFTVTPLHAQSGAGNRAAALAGEGRKASANASEKAGMPKAATAIGAGRGASADIPDAAMRVMAQQLRVALMSGPDAPARREMVKVEDQRDTIRIHLMDSARRSMFAAGTAQLNGFGRQLLNDVAAKVAGSRVRLAVEGHTDGVGGNSEANWALSAARAASARRALADAGMSDDRFQGVIAMAASQPVYPDQPGRPENRRITINLHPFGSPLPASADFRPGDR